MQKPKFKVEFLEDALEFLGNLDEKVRDKIIYNITKSRFSNDNELFKNSLLKFGSLEHFLIKHITGFCFLGQIKQV